METDAQQRKKQTLIDMEQLGALLAGKKSPTVPAAPATAPIAAPVELPAGSPPKTGNRLLSGMSVLGGSLAQTPKAAGMAGIDLVQGKEGVDIVQPGNLERARGTWQSDLDRRRERLSSEYGEQTLIPGIKIARDVGTLPENLGFSGVAMGAGLAGQLAGGAVGRAVGGPVGGAIGKYAGGLLGAGKAAYEMSEAKKMREILTKAQDEKITQTGEGLTKEEQDKLRKEFSPAVSKYALWEAVPEAASTVIGLGAGRMVTKPFVKSTLAKVGWGGVLKEGTEEATRELTAKGVSLAVAKLIGERYATEAVTEAVTQHGQHNVDVELGLAPGEKRSFLSPSDWVQSIEEVLPGVLLLGTVMGPSMGAATAAGRYAQERYQLAASADRVKSAVANLVRTGEISDPRLNLESLKQAHVFVSDLVGRRPKDMGLKQALDTLTGETRRRAEEHNQFLGNLETIIRSDDLQAKEQGFALYEKFVKPNATWEDYEQVYDRVRGGSSFTREGDLTPRMDDAEMLKVARHRYADPRDPFGAADLQRIAQARPHLQGQVEELRRTGDIRNALADFDSGKSREGIKAEHPDVDVDLTIIDDKARQFDQRLNRSALADVSEDAIGTASRMDMDGVPVGSLTDQDQAALRKAGLVTTFTSEAGGTMEVTADGTTDHLLREMRRRRNGEPVEAAPIEQTAEEAPQELPPWQMNQEQYAAFQQTDQGKAFRSMPYDRLQQQYRAKGVGETIEPAPIRPTAEQPSAQQAAAEGQAHIEYLKQAEAGRTGFGQDFQAAVDWARENKHEAGLQSAARAVINEIDHYEKQIAAADPATTPQQWFDFARQKVEEGKRRLADIANRYTEVTKRPAAPTVTSEKPSERLTAPTTEQTAGEWKSTPDGFERDGLRVRRVLDQPNNWYYEWEQNGEMVSPAGTYRTAEEAMQAAEAKQAELKGKAETVGRVRAAYEKVRQARGGKSHAVPIQELMVAAGMTEAEMEAAIVQGMRQGWAMPMRGDSAKGVAAVTINGKPFPLVRINPDKMPVEAKTEQAEAKTEAPPVERRKDLERRKRVSEMTSEELRKELHTDHLTGLKNKRAWEEMEAEGKIGKRRLFLDADSLKWVNDTLGHDAGDDLLILIAEALEDAMPGAFFHVSGDEYYGHADDDIALDNAVKKAKDYLKRNRLKFENDEGVVDELEGQFSYGVGDTIAEAEERARDQKLAREVRGERAGRGETPKGLYRGRSVGRDQGAPVLQPEKTPAPRGKSTEVVYPGGKDRAHYEVREAADLIPSHNPARNFGKRPDYPANIQTRAYHADLSEAAKVRRFMANADEARTYVYETLVDLLTPDKGAPIVTKDGVVIGGNGRAMALQLAIEERPQSARAYFDALRERAAAFGIDPKSIEGMKEPVLVRVLDEDMDTRQMQERAHLYNKPTTQAQDVTAEGVANARNITDNTLTRLADGMADFGTLREFFASQKSKPFVEGLIKDKVIAPTEIGRYVDQKTDMLSEAGKDLVERMLRGLIISDYDLLNNLPAGVTTKLDRTLAQMIQLRKLGKGWDLIKDFEAAVRGLRAFQGSGFTDVDDWLRQGSMWAEADQAAEVRDNPRVYGLTKALATVSKPTEWKRMVAQFLEDGQAAAGQADGLFVAEPRSADEAFADAFGISRERKTGPDSGEVVPGEEAIPKGPERAPANSETEDKIIQAWRSAVDAGGFLDVHNSEIAERSGLPREVVVSRLQEMAREGRAVFSQGDWSLASPQQREASLTIRGKPYIMVRLYIEDEGEVSAAPDTEDSAATDDISRNSDIPIVKEPWGMTRREFIEHEKRYENQNALDALDDLYKKALISEKKGLGRTVSEKQIKLSAKKYGVFYSDIIRTSNRFYELTLLKGSRDRYWISKWDAPVMGRHKPIIQQALAEGKFVPAEVLDDYPELKKYTGQQDVSAIRQRIRDAAYKAAGNRWDARVRLADLREALPDMPREQLDELLREMEAAGELTLYRLDDPAEIKDRDKQAAMTLVGGDKRHIFYMSKPKAEQVQYSAGRARTAIREDMKSTGMDSADIDAIGATLTDEEAIAIRRASLEDRARAILKDKPTDQVDAMLVRMDDDTMKALKDGDPKTNWQELKDLQPARQEAELTEADVREIFKGEVKRGAQVNRNVDGSWSIIDKKGQEIRIENVDRIEGGVEVQLAHGAGARAKGSYQKQRIKIVRDADGKWLLGHEHFHLLRDLGVISAYDYGLMKREALKKYPGGQKAVEEKIADWYADARTRMDEQRSYMRRVLDRIREWVDALANYAWRATEGRIGRRTAAGVVRDIERGRIGRQETGAEQGAAYAAGRFGNRKVKVIPVDTGIVNPVDDSYKALRSTVQEYAFTNIQGKTFVNKQTSNEIYIGKKAILKGTQAAKKNEDLMVIAAIPRLIEDSTLVWTSHDLKGRKSIAGIEYYYVPVSIGGSLYRVEIIVRVIEKEGRRYYAHHVESIKIKEMPSHLPAGTDYSAATGPQDIPSEITMDELMANVKARGLDSEIHGRDQFSAGRPQTEVKVSQSLDATHKVNPKAEAKALQKGSEAIAKRARDNWAGKKTDTGLRHKILSLPSHHFEKIPALGRMFEAAQDRVDRRFMLIDDLTKDETGRISTVQLQKLQKERPEEYKKLGEWVVTRDRKRVGYKVYEINKGAWRLFDPKGKAAGEYTTEQEAWSVARVREAEDYRKAGGSEQGAEALLGFRRTLDRGFDMYARSMREIIARHNKLGMELPQVAVLEGDETVHVDLQWALAQLGDTRGYYFPRIREGGRFRLVARKAGANPIMEFYDFGGPRLDKISQAIESKAGKGLPIPMLRRRDQLEKQGYAVTLSDAPKLSEEVYDLAKQTVAMQAVLNEALRRMEAEAKSASLENYGLKGEWDESKTEFRLIGPTSKAQNEVIKSLGGRFYKTTGDERRIWRFQNAPRDMERRIILALMGEQALSGVDKELEVAFAKELTEQVANIFKGRGFRERMIARGDETEDQVWLGYEEDPTKALAQYVAGLSAGEAKRELAGKLTRFVTGTDLSWEGYQAHHQTEEWEAHKKENPQADRKKWLQTYQPPSYEDYIRFVRERRVDPVKQPNAFDEALAFISDLLRNQEFGDRVIGILRGLAVFKYLGFRVAAPLVNLTVLPTAVPATLKGYAGVPFHRGIPLLLKGMRKYGQWRFPKAFGGELTAEERRFFDDMNRRGWNRSQYNQEALGVLKSRVGRGWDKMLEYSMAMFGVAEEINRAATLSAAYFGIREQHQGEWSEANHEAAMAKAKIASDRAHGVYGRENWPYWVRGTNPAARLAQMFYVFKTFTKNYLNTMVELGFERRQVQSSLWMLLAPGILFGAGTTLATPIIATLAKALGIGGDDPEEEFYKLAGDNIGDWAETYARYGIPGLMGVSVKGSLQMGISDLPTKTADLIGAPGSVVLDLYEGGKKIAKGNISKGIEQMLPLAASNPIKAARESTEGLTTRTNAPIFYGDQPVKLDMTEAILRGLSFNPARVAQIREVQWKERKAEMKYRDDRTDIYARIKQFYLRPIEEQTMERWAADILPLIEKYNRKAENADQPLITGKAIRANLKRSFRPSRRERQREV